MTDFDTSVARHSDSKSLGDTVFGFVRLIVVLSSLATVVALFANRWWISDLCANLRIQWMVALLTGAVLFVIGKQWKWVTACLLMFAINVPSILSGLAQPAARQLANSPNHFTVATFNVLTSNQDYAAIERQLLQSNADVIAIPELSHGLEKHLAANFAKTYFWSRTEVPGNGNFGIGLYSKHEWNSSRIFILNDQRIPSVEANLTINGRSVYVVATHTLPPIGAYGHRHRSEHLERLAQRITDKRQTNESASVVVMGDLNLTPWSPFFAKFCDESSLRNMGQGMTPTWYALPLFPFGLVLDHVLGSTDLQMVNYAISPAAGSDHRMVTVRLAFSNAD